MYKLFSVISEGKYEIPAEVAPLLQDLIKSEWLFSRKTRLEKPMFLYSCFFCMHLLCFSVYCMVENMAESVSHLEINIYNLIQVILHLIFVTSLPSRGLSMKDIYSA